MTILVIDQEENPKETQVFGAIAWKVRDSWGGVEHNSLPLCVRNNDIFEGGKHSGRISIHL